MIFDSKYSICDINQAVVVSSEKGNKHVLNNKSGFHIFQYHIDGGMIKDEKGERCDFIVEVESPPFSSVYVIELKGSDLTKAISQIQSTISTYDCQMRKCQILPRIIIHRVPTHDTHGKQYRDFKKKYPNAVVKVKQYSENV